MGVSKWVGDLANHGLYDIHIMLKSVPLLEWETTNFAEKLVASDIMSTRLKYIYPHTRVESIINLLKTTAHNCFPVVKICCNDENEAQSSSLVNYDAQLESKHQETLEHHTQSVRNGVLSRNLDDTTITSSNSEQLLFQGMILRSQLVTLVEHDVNYHQGKDSSSQKVLDFNEMNEKYPRFPDIADIPLCNVSLENIVDVSYYMHPCPYVVYDNTTVDQVFNLFRTMGLRHLPVLNKKGIILGIITRHNLTHDFLESVLENLQRSRPSSRIFSSTVA